MSANQASWIIADIVKTALAICPWLENVELKIELYFRI